MGNIADVIEPGGHRLTMVCSRWAASGYNPAAEGVEVLCSSSAGAWASLYLAAGRIKDTRPIWLALSDPGAFSAWNVLLYGTMANVHLVFDIVNVVAPIDFKIIDDLPIAIIVTIFRESDGEPLYELLTSQNARELLGATIAVPPFSDRWFYQGESYCDGGGADPIPIQRMIDDGFEDIRVWLTRELGYSIPGYERLFPWIPWPFVPITVRNAIFFRIRRHEEAHRLIKEPPPGIRIRPIYPPHPSPCLRISHERNRVEEAWRIGWQQGLLDRQTSLAL